MSQQKSILWRHLFQTQTTSFAYSDGQPNKYEDYSRKSLEVAKTGALNTPQYDFLVCGGSGIVDCANIKTDCKKTDTSTAL